MDTPKLFAAALGLKSPWLVEAVRFEPGKGKGCGKLEIRIDFERGGELPCPECKQACKAHDTDEQSCARAGGLSTSSSTRRTSWRGCRECAARRTAS